MEWPLESLALPLSRAYLKVFLSCSNDPLSEDRTLHFHIDLVKWTHDGFDPVFVDFDKEVLDGFLGCSAGGIGSDRGG